MGKFTVIIPVFQTPKILRLFLDSLAQTLTQDTDLIFVNDGSGHCVQELLETFRQEMSHKRSGNRIIILENRISRGSVSAINAALQQVDPICGYVAFLDSDTILQGRWQDQLLASFTEEDIGAVGGMLLYPQSGGIQCCGLTYCGSAGRHLYLNSSPDTLGLTAPFEVQATVFAFFCIRRSVIQKVGFLDEHFYNGYEDLDYQFRLRKLGYRILTNPMIRHYHWEKSNGSHREYNRKSNLGRFWLKHGPYVKDDLTHFARCQLQRLAPAPGPYSAFDFCEGRTAADTVKDWLNNCPFISVETWEEILYTRQSNDTIWLPELLDSGQAYNPRPFLFLCDQFVQLLDNQYWWSIRRKAGAGDIVIDLYGNVLPFSQLQQSFWPGRKIR